MADFCKQCSIDLWGEDTGDFKGFISEEDVAKGLVSCVVLCETCGPIQVDHTGACVSQDCWLNGHKTPVSIPDP